MPLIHLFLPTTSLTQLGLFSPRCFSPNAVFMLQMQVPCACCLLLLGFVSYRFTCHLLYFPYFFSLLHFITEMSDIETYIHRHISVFISIVLSSHYHISSMDLFFFPFFSSDLQCLEFFLEYSKHAMDMYRMDK